jgi:S-adenosylmethionine-diacylgycerolhomoserine-N-methlytransferase
MSVPDRIKSAILPDSTTDMDRMYRLQRHIYDATRKYYLLGREHLIAGLDVPDGGRVLEIGCGTGRNLVKVAQAYPKAQVFGVDISDEMLKSAATAMWKAKLNGRIRIAQGDATSFDSHRTFGFGSFERIYLSYTLSMIPQWRTALSHAFELLAPQGRLSIVDFGQCENLPPAFKSLLFLWLRQFNVEPRADAAAELSRLASRAGLSSKFTSQLRGYCWQLSAGISGQDA